MQKLTRAEYTSAVSQMAGAVYDFHERFGLSAVEARTAPEEALAKLRSRLSLLIEEVGEHATELNRGNLNEAMAELADVSFVVLGTLLVLDESGRDASHQVTVKNNGKTAESHALSQSSGKLVRRPRDA